MKLPASQPAERTLIKGKTAHSIRGRLRLSYTGLKYLKNEAREIAHEVSRLPFVKRAAVTPSTGSLLVEYDYELSLIHI